MSVGMVLLTAAAILVFFGVAQRVLDKMYLSDRAALLLIALMFFGTLIPNLKLGTVELSIGGALIPAGVCVYLLIRAGTWKERLRAIVGALVTGGAVFAISAYLLPDEPEAMVIDPMYLNGIIAGLIAYVLGRSRRGAFICGVLGETPLLTAGLHLGEGTGAVASIPLWDMALAVYDGCYSFAEGGIAPYMPQC